MQYSITAAILFALGSNVAHCGPLIARQSNPPTLQDIADAQNQWSSDSTKVSQFLSVAESLSPEQLVIQATDALSAELDELIRKAVLDSQFVFVSSPDEDVQKANNALVDQGSFWFVVTGLQSLMEDGTHMTANEVSDAIQSINQDRCSVVLPSIDIYFRAAAKLLNNGVTLLANRPVNCP